MNVYWQNDFITDTSQRLGAYCYLFKRNEVRCHSDSINSALLVSQLTSMRVVGVFRTLA